MEEVIPTLMEEGEERIDTLEESTIIAGVQTINGKAGDLNLKTINGQDLLTTGNLALATSAQMTAETEAREAADTAEATARANADNAEKTARENADTALQNAINTKQDKLIAGANIQIASDGKTISATDTTYSAGNGMKLNGTTFAVDTNAIQTKLSTTQMDAVNSGATTAKIAQITTNQGDISTINGKIPTQASTSNQLADKNFVNSSVQTATANFRGSWADWASVPTSASAYPPDYAGSTTPTVNDYLVIQDASDYTEETLDGTWRFKYTGDWDTDGKAGWLPEYQVNETPMTAAQLAAINSGITDTLVAQISTNAGNITSLQNGKQDNLNSAQLDAVNSGIDSTKVAQIATNAGNITALQTGKQDKLTAGSNIQIDQDTATISATDTTYTAGTGLNLNDTTFSADTTVLATQTDLATKADASDVYTKAEVNAGTDNLGVPSGFFTGTPTASAEGTFLTLANTAEAPFSELTLKGDSFQQTYTGKNLMNATTASAVSSGLTYAGDTGQITLDGTRSSAGSVNWSNFSLKAGTYILMLELVSGTITSTSTGGLFYVYGDNITGNSRATNLSSSNPRAYQTITVSADTTNAHLNTWARATETYANAVIKYQLIAGSTEDYDFEPYVGGVPAPNPDYPQAIQVVTGEQTVKVMGKNLIDYDNRSINRVWNSSYEFVGSGVYDTSPRIDCVGGSTITMSRASVTGYFKWVVMEFASDATPIARQVNPGSTENVWTVTLSNNTAYCYIGWRNDILGSGNIMAELGSTATDYVPYQSQSYPISLGSLELAKIGTYQDYIWTDGEKWWKRKAIRAYNFANFTYTSATTKQTYGYVVGTSVNPLVGAVNPLVGLCSHFTIESTNTTWTGLNKTGTNAVNSLWFQTTAESGGDTRTAEQFIDWASSNNLAFYYALTTPTDEEITDATLISQLNALYRGRLVEGVTNISSASTSPNLPIIISAEAFKNNWPGTIGGVLKSLDNLDTRVSALENA